MLRINLLPPYIYDKQKKVKVLIFWAVALVAVIGVFLFMMSGLNQQLAAATSDKETAEGLKSQYAQADTQINAEKQNRASIELRQTFIKNAQDYNRSWPAFFETMKDVTSPNIYLKTLSGPRGP